MEWVERHQVLLAVCVLAALTLVGVVVLAVRAFILNRVARSSMSRVDAPVREITTGLADAERRVGAIADGQAELTTAIDRVASHTGELRVLMDHAGRALAVLRSPFRYLGR